MQEKLEEYILNHIDAEPEMMRQLNRDTHVYHLYSRMCSGHLQGRILNAFSNLAHLLVIQHFASLKVCPKMPYFTLLRLTMK